MTFWESGRVHFIGIGGAGMSAIAKVLLERGARISGSDLKRSRAVTVLEAMGAEVQVGHSAAHVSGATAVVVSSAISKRNPEVVAAEAAGIPIIARGEALAQILATHRSIVIAGTHGKTTTTSMVVSILRTAGIDPTYLVGAGLNDVGTNARSGRDDLAVAESDESDGSFLSIRPDIAVVTNIEIDHVDYWAGVDALRDAFERFVSSPKERAAAAVPVDETALAAAAEAAGKSVVTFGPGGDVAAEDVSDGFGSSRFRLVVGGEGADVHLAVPGLHNVSNALAAAAASSLAGLSVEDIATGLGSFRGVERRFQVRGEAGGVTVVDDYAHHPTEVRATLAATRPGPWERVVAVFQPHRYSRTAALSSEFGGAFGGADRIVITDVYGAGEDPVPGITGKLIADAVCERLPGRAVVYLPHRADLLSYLEKSARPGDVLLTLGAGDVNSVGEELLTRLGRAR